MEWDTLWIDCHLVTMAQEDLGIIPQAAIAVKDQKIVWLGEQKFLPTMKAKKTIACHGGWITPGFIDCHTHLIFAGNRAQEFAQRLKGKTYAEIAASGGGIRSTVAATKQASLQQLYQQSLPRLKALMAEGVTTIEIKSGYGLDEITEGNMLRVARQFAADFPVDIVTTYLGAHCVPVDGDSDEYIETICQQILPHLAQQGLVDAVDGFCENIAFSTEQMRRVFTKAKQLGLPVKLHAEQLSNQNGAGLAAEFQALSADHLEYLTEENIQAMQRAGTVAVLLPGAFYYLKEQKLPPVNLLRQYEIPMAIATDCNPGTSPICSLQLMLNMACTLFGLTVEEALLAVTKNAAKALGQHHIGQLKPGYQADFVVWQVQHVTDLVYQIGLNPIQQIIKKGAIGYHAGES